MPSFRFFSVLSLCLLLLAAVLPAQAGDDLYYVEKLVPDESPDSRYRAFVRGLDEVFIRIAGDSVIMSKLKRPPASRYVKQFTYEALPEPQLNDDDEILNYRVKMHFNGKLMEQYLRENNFPIWDEHRPATVVWLAVSDGVNRYVLREQDSSEIKTAMAQALHRRGIPARWPSYDARDRKKLSIVDIRGGFRDQVVAASQRYSRGPALSISLQWNGRQWLSSWNLLMQGAERHFSEQGADYRALIDRAVDRVADAMGAAFAVHNIGQGSPQAVIRLRIDDVNSVLKYRQLEEYLAGLAMVSALSPVEVGADSVLFELSLRTDEEVLLNLIDSDGKLRKVKVETAPQPVENRSMPDPQSGASGSPPAPPLPPGAAGEQGSPTAPAQPPGAASASATSSVAPAAASAAVTPAAGVAPTTPSPGLPTYHYRLLR